MCDPVDLYMGNLVQDLNARAEENVKNIASAKAGLNSMGKTYEAAEKAALDRDEERAYVLYMRTLFVYDRIKRMPDFKRAEFRMAKEMVRATNQAEKLAASLKERYQRVEAEQLAKRLESAVETKSATPDGGTAIVRKSNRASEKSSTKSSAAPSNNLDAAALYKLLKSADSAPNVLVFDLRPAAEFADCRLRHDCLINIDGGLIKPGFSVSGVEALVPPDKQTLWKARRAMSHVVIMDWRSDEKSLNAQHPAQVLKDAIYKWDSAGALKCEPQLLHRGLQGVLLAYPTLTTDPAYRGPSDNSNGTNGGGGGLSGIVAYPSLEDENRRRLEEQRRARLAAAAAAEAEAVAKKAEQQDNLAKELAERDRERALKERERERENQEQTSASVTASDSKTGPSMPNVDRSLKPPPPQSTLKQPTSLASAKADSATSAPTGGASVEEISSGGSSGSAGKPRVDRSNKPAIAKASKMASSSASEAPAALTISIAPGPAAMHSAMKPGLRLPSGWHVGNENGRYFYVDTKAGKMYWDLPDDILDMQERPPAKPASAAPAQPSTAAQAEPESTTAPAPQRPEKPKSTSVEPLAPAAPPAALPAVTPAAPSAALPAVATAAAPATAPAGSNLKRVASQPNLAKLRTKPDSSSATVATTSTPSRQPSGKEPDAVSTVTRPFSDFDARMLNRMAPEYGSVPHGITGLRNLGNTCYLNSTVQCLSNTAVLTSYFLQGTFRDHVNQSNPLGHQGEVAEQFSVVVHALWAGRYTCVSPYDFKSIIGRHAEAFSGSEQQDSQEFLLFLLDGLHEDLNRARRRRPPPELEDKEGLADAERARRAWARHCLINESIMVELFQGQFKSTLVCEQCHYKSITFDAFMYLSLPVVSDTSCRLSDCLQAFLKPERLSGSSRWFCPRCRRDQSAVKKIDIWRLPPYLLIHLKRFSCDRLNSRGRKLNTLVDCPITGLDMAPYHSADVKPTQSPVYNLYAVSNHFGSMECGHYTAFCRNANLNRWFKFDDESVSELRVSEIRSVSNYILFYSRLQDRFKVASQ